MYLILLITTIIIALAIIVAIFGNTKSSRNVFDSDEKLPYKRKDYLLTVTERKFFDVLKKVADEAGHLLFVKVRLEDLLWIPKNTKNRFGLRNRIKSRHIDFVLCDTENIRPLVVIELDDTSHERKDRVERDHNIDRILKDAGLPILHVRVADSYDQEILKNQIYERLD